jgi:hypothetical protein
MEASSAGKHEYGGKRRGVKYWVRLGCWISPCHGPFSLGTQFETYELFISLIFQFFSGRGKLRITETTDMGACLYITFGRDSTCSCSNMQQMAQEFVTCDSVDKWM